MIEMKHIQKRFKDNLVLKDVTLTFDMGEVYALIGPNGTGKLL